MGEKFALIIGIEHYQDASISPVHFAEDDAKGIFEALELHGFAQTSMDILLSPQATKATIESRLRKCCAKASSEDYFIMFYAGHGFAENDHNFITCHDTQRGDLANTSISLQNVMREIRKSKSKRVVLFLDSCHSGLEFEEGMRGILSDMSEEELLEFFKDSEFHVGFAACEHNQYSYPSNSLSHGIWSYHVISALKGNEPTALERKRFLTANSLQVYLSQEVPRTVRKTLTGSKIQTPCMFGNLTKDFMIADLEPVLEAKKIKAQPQLTQLKRILFRGEETGRVKSLSGFSRGYHRVPNTVNDATERFVAKIGQEEVNMKAERLYEQIKKEFDYKRKDIDMKSGGGSASIICKDFDVDISLSLNPNDPSEYLLKIETNNFRSPEIVKSRIFNKVFERIFTSLVFEFTQQINTVEIIDAIEELNDESISIEYPSNEITCTIKMKGVDGVINISPGEFCITYDNPVQPIVLVESFFGVQRLLVNTHNIKALPFT
jgi:hypothetical protein